MVEVGVLADRAAELVARAVAGETVVVTDGGRPIAQLAPLATSVLDDLIRAGRARAAITKLADLGPPPVGPALSEELACRRDTER